MIEKGELLFDPRKPEYCEILFVLRDPVKKGEEVTLPPGTIYIMKKKYKDGKVQTTITHSNEELENKLPLEVFKQYLK